MLGFLSTRPAWSLIVASGAILLFGFLLFSFISRKGKKMLLAGQGTALQQIVHQPLASLDLESCEKLKVVE
jgi:hypothetical protein